MARIYRSSLASGKPGNWRFLKEKSQWTGHTIKRELPRLARAVAFTVITAFILARLLSSSSLFSITGSSSSKSDASELRCRSLPNANETLVIVKTGVNEIAHKLPIHMDTTFRCYPHLLVYSDHNETFRDLEIHDALEPIDQAMKMAHPDFEFYWRVKSKGREMLAEEQLTSHAGLDRHPDDEAKLAKIGWRMDKWKFLPMWNETYVLPRGSTDRTC